jgi:hypothetical protein
VLALGVAWILDGLEITIASSISRILGQPDILHMSSTAVGAVATSAASMRGHASLVDHGWTNGRVRQVAASWRRHSQQRYLSLHRQAADLVASTAAWLFRYDGPTVPANSARLSIRQQNPAAPVPLYAVRSRLTYSPARGPR